MTPDEVTEIFAAANEAYETVTSKTTYSDTDKFDETVSALLVELVRERDGDKYGMLHLSQDPSKHSALTGSNLSKICAIEAYDNDIDADATDLVRKRAEVVWKMKLNVSKVEAAAERGTKNIY